MFLLTLLALYPALWADPLGVVQALASFGEHHIEMAQRPIFFLGQMTYHPGPTFYPLVLLVRISPVVLVGLLIGLVRLRRLSPARRLLLVTLVAFAIFFGAVVSIAAKQHDRYLLPAFPPLALAAALSLPYSFYQRRFKPFIPVVLQLAFLLPFVAHPLTYANPLLGGPWVGGQVISLEWGERMGMVARQLNGLPQSAQLTAAAANVPSFAALFAGHTVPLDDAHTPLADLVVQSTGVLSNTAPLQQATFLAAHASPDALILLDAATPLLRHYDGPGELASPALPDEAALAAWLAEQAAGRDAIWLVSSPAASPITAAQLRRQVECIATPVSTATVASATITRFDIRPSSPVTTPSPYRALFGGRLLLVDGALPPAVAWPDPLRVTIRWQALGVPPTAYRSVLTLRGGEGSEWASGDQLVVNDVTFPTSAWAPGEWADMVYTLTPPPPIPPGEYALEASLYDAASGAGLGGAGPDGAFCGTRVVLGTVTIAMPAAPPSLADLGLVEPLALSAGPLTLLGLEPPAAQLLSGDRLLLAAFWQADTAPEEDYRVRLRLVDGTGVVGLERTLDLSPFPTSRWRAGDRFESRYGLHLSPELGPGSYRLTLNVLDGTGVAIWRADEELTAVEVLPRERSFELPQIPHSLDFSFGEAARLRGYGLERAEAVPGESLHLTLVWQAMGPADRDYTLFVHLLGPDGIVHGQIDRLDYSAPPTSWAVGQVLVDEIDLPVAADAPPGSYRIAVGFYDAAYGDRLSVTDEAGTPLPDDRALLPAVVTVTGATP